MAPQQDGPASDAEFRVEHDSMGEVRVPAWAKWRAQTQRAVENFPISGTPIERELIGALAAIKGAAAAVNAELGVLDAEIADAIRGAAARGRPGRVGRALPDRRLPDRLGHVEQHEHQRGDRHPRHRGARHAGAPQRPRERVAVVQRRLPLGHPRGGHRRDRPRPGPGPAAPRAVAVAQGRRVRRGRQERPHPPDGRHPGDPGPGVRRLRGRRPLRHRAAAGLPAPHRRAARWAAPPSAPASTPRPGSPPRSSSGSPASWTCR